MFNTCLLLFITAYKHREIMPESDERQARIISTLAKCESITDPEKYYDDLMQVKKNFRDDGDKALLVKVVEAIGAEERMLILDCLKGKDHCVCELEAIFGKAQSSVSHHLKILEDAGLIKGWKKGKFTHYSLVRPRFERFMDIFTRWINSTLNWFGET